MKNFLWPVFFLAVSTLGQQRGNGDRVDSFPGFNERQLLVLTNACRMAPAQYRDLYIGNYQVLLPGNYPAVQPLFWNLALNKSSHAHSVDMADNCGLQHPSCDGTAWNTRIQSFYNNKNGTLGENIATGNQTALATAKQWILEVNPATTPVPADKDTTGADGHRRNIMNGSYKELGCGYAYSASRQWNYFWTQDFAGGKPDFNTPLIAGCHFFIEPGKITFFVNYYDSAGSAPTEVSCIIDGQKTAMALALGSAGKGTYTLVQTKGTLCRQYYFTCTKNGTAYRYPEYGMLSTFGEGTCARDYIPPESLSVIVPPLKISTCSGLRIEYLRNNVIEITSSALLDNQVTIVIADLRGRTLSKIFPTTIGRTHCSIALPKNSGQNMSVVFIKSCGGKNVAFAVPHSFLSSNLTSNVW